MPKSLKECKTPADERAYLSESRLSEEDWSEMEDVELAPAAPKSATMSLAFDKDVTHQLRLVAKRKGLAYTTMVRDWVLERLNVELKPQLKARSGGKK